MIASSDSRSGSEVPQRRYSPSGDACSQIAGGADQQLERAAEPAALAGDDLVVDALLRRVHLGDGDLAVTAHRCSPAAADCGDEPSRSGMPNQRAIRHCRAGRLSRIAALQRAATGRETGRLLPEAGSRRHPARHYGELIRLKAACQLALPCCGRALVHQEIARMTEHPAGAGRQPRFGKTRAAAVGFGLGADARAVAAGLGPDPRRTPAPNATPPLSQARRSCRSRVSRRWSSGCCRRSSTSRSPRSPARR